MGLSTRDRAILDFERGWWSRPGPKEAAIRTELGVSATRYYEILRHLVDVPEAYDYDPLTVKRVRRERDRRRRERLEGRQADPGSGDRPERGGRSVAVAGCLRRRRVARWLVVGLAVILGIVGLQILDDSGPSSSDATVTTTRRHRVGPRHRSPRTTTARCKTNGQVRVKVYNAVGCAGRRARR